MNWVRSRRWAFYIVTVRVQSFLLKIWLFIQSRSIYKQSTTFIRYLVEDKLVILEKICGSKNSADMLTKGVTIKKLKLCATSIGLLVWGEEDELQGWEIVIWRIVVDVGDGTSLQVGDLLGFVEPSFVWSGSMTWPDPNNIVWFLTGNFFWPIFI